MDFPSGKVSKETRERLYSEDPGLKEKIDHVLECKHWNIAERVCECEQWKEWDKLTTEERLAAAKTKAWTI